MKNKSIKKSWIILSAIFSFTLLQPLFANCTIINNINVNNNLKINNGPELLLPSAVWSSGVSFNWHGSESQDDPIWNADYNETSGYTLSSCLYDTENGDIIMDNPILNDVYDDTSGQLPAPSGPIYKLSNQLFTNVAVTNGTFTFGANVKEMDDGTFYASNYSSNISIDFDAIDMSSSKLEIIPANCFRDMTKLTTVSFSNLTKTIKTNAFAGDTSLTNISIPSSVSNLEANIFSGCTNLKSITLNWSQSQIQSIVETSTIDLSWLGDIANNNITIYVPSGSITTYNDYASQLGLSTCVFVDGTTINAPATKIFTGQDVSGSVNLEIKDDGLYINSVSNLSGSSLAINDRFILNEINYSIVGLADNAFSAAGVSGTFTIPSTIQYVGQDCFNSCLQITDFIVNIVSNDFDKIFQQSAFANCSSLKSFKLPYASLLNFKPKYGFDFESVLVYASDATAKDVFWRSSSLEGTCSVQKNSSLDYIILDGTDITGSDLSTKYEIKAIADNAFMNNENISGSFNFTNSLTSIGANAFDGCTNLVNINIPSKVWNIGSNAFNNCSSISSITLNWDNEQLDIWFNQQDSSSSIDQNWLGNIDHSNITINVPYGTKTTYEKYENELGIVGCNIVEQEKPQSKNVNVTLVTWLTFWVGLPTIAVIITGIGYYNSIKKHKI